MLNDATCFKAVYIVCGYTDRRAGMDRLAALVEAQTGSRPYVPDTLYLFCGRRTDRIKGLVWEGDGWLLLYRFAPVLYRYRLSTVYVLKNRNFL